MQLVQKPYGRTGHECPSRRVFLYHTSRTSRVINHIPIERGVSCGGNQVLFFINFGVRTQKIRREYLNGQIVSEFVSGCLNLNLNLNFRLNFKYVSEHDVGFPNHPTTRLGSKVMTFQRHHYQPDSGQRFKPSSAVNLTVSGFPVRIRFTHNSTVNSL